MRVVTMPARGRAGGRLRRAGGAVRRPLLALVGVVVFALAGARAAQAAEWGAIIPGQSTTDSVREQYGAPTRETPLKIEGYDALSWVYEGDRAPRGVRRLAVEFGLLTAQGYQPRTVRLLRLEPAPGVFTRQTVVMGWGVPTRVGQEDTGPVFFYQSGVLVEFDKEGWQVRRLTFTVPQPRLEE